MFQFALIATTIEMTLCLSCSILLWMRRREAGDHSRHVLAGVSFTCVIWSLGKYHEYIVHPDANIYTNILSPEHCFLGLLCLIFYFFYPVIVMRPRWFSWRRVLLLMLPWLLVSPPYLLGMPFRSLANAGDILTYITEFNVWWRMLTVSIVAIYMILLLMLPFNWCHSSADSSWVRRYTLAIALMAVFYFGYQLTLWMPFHLVHQVYVGLFFVYYTHFELVERLMPVAASSPSPAVEAHEGPQEQPEQPEPGDDDATGPADTQDHLWQRIKQELDDRQAWKNPELTVDMLARMVGSNKTYVHQAFATYGGTNYKDYINRRRVDFIAAQLRSKPNQNLENLFYRAGYRSRTTAGRNFKDIMGISPSDYATSL